MKRTIELPSGRMLEHKPAHPERTAYRTVEASFGSSRWGNVEVREFPNVESMRTCMDMQGKSADQRHAYRPWPTAKP